MPKKYPAACLLIVSLCLVSFGFAQEEPAKVTAEQQTAHSFEAVNDDGSTQKLGYLLFLPKQYLEQSKQLSAQKTEREETEKQTNEAPKWPLMVFLHGAGERGEDLELVKKWGPPKLVANKPDFPFVLLSPQCPKGIYWNISHLNQLIDQTIADNRIDSSRIYVVGLSMGGFGTWSLVAAHPDKFAAAIPICGGGDVASSKALTSTPIWAFHGDQDSVVPVERTTKMVEAVEKAGGQKIKSTIYPGVNHNSWTQTFANPQIYDWLLSHRRE